MESIWIEKIENQRHNRNMMLSLSYQHFHFDIACVALRPRDYIFFHIQHIFAPGPRFLSFSLHYLPLTSKFKSVHVHWLHVSSYVGIKRGIGDKARNWG